MDNMSRYVAVGMALLGGALVTLLGSVVSGAALMIGCVVLVIGADEICSAIKATKR